MASDEAKKIDKEDVGSAGSDKAADTQAAAELLFTRQVEKHLDRLCEIAFSILRTGEKINQARFTAELAVGEKDALLPLAKALKADGPVFAKMIRDGVCMHTNGNAPVLLGFLTEASSYEEAVKIAKDASGDDPEEERRQEEERLKRNKEVAARKAVERAIEEEEQRKNAQKAAAVPLASTATSAPAIPGVPATDSVPANSALEGASENVEQSILKFIAGEQIGASEQRIKDYLGKGSLSKKQRQELLARLVREDRLEFKDGNYHVKKKDVLDPKVNQTSPASAVLAQADPANSPDASKIDAVKTQPTMEDVGAKKKQDDAFLKEFTMRLTDALTEKLKDVDAAGADVKKPVELATPEQIKEEGNKLDLLVEDISDLLDRVAKGRKIGDRLWKKIGDGFSEIYETAATLERAGLVLPPRGKEAMQSLEATIEARDVEDPAKARDGIRLIERLLRDEFRKQKAQSNLVEKSVSVVTAGGELPAPSVAAPRNEGTKQISSEIQELVKHAKDFRDIFLKARDRGRNGQKDGVGAIQGMRKVISQIEKLVSGLTGEEKKRFQRDVDSLRDEYLSLFDEKFLPGAVPSEAKKGNLFVDAKNFNELHAILEKLGSLVISGGLRTASQLIDDIEEVRNGRSGLERITRTGGLRSAVERILAIEASINSNAPKSIPGSEDVESGVSVDVLPEKIASLVFRERLGAPMSRRLPENLASKTDPMGSGTYMKILADYSFPWADIHAYNAAHPDQIKFDFIDEKDANIGWKVHLNVPPEHVLAVSEYLKANGYDHKYLHGGEPENGKIFTVYTGSYAITVKLAQSLSKDLSDKLARPLASGEIEFARGVIGRFSGARYNKDKERSDLFHQYGTLGFTLLKEDLDRIWSRLHWATEHKQLYRKYYELRQAGDWKAVEEFIKQDKTGAVKAYDQEIAAAEARAYAKLRELYGDYFSPITSWETPLADDTKSEIAPDAKPESSLDQISRLRAGSFMVQKVLERYAADNNGAESPVAGRLMKRLITELLSDFESNRLKPNLQLMQLVAKIRGAIREHDDPRFERNNGKQVSFVELAADITAALTSQSREEYKKWADENPDSLKKDFFNREGNELMDISETVALWLNELAGADSLDAATREEITKELLVFQQKAHKNLNDWAEQRSLSMAKLKKIDPTASAQASVVASAPAVAAAASPVASSILTAPAENLPSTPLAVKLENGEFKTTMTEAFSNSDFMSFFEAFDAIKDRPWFKGKLYGSFDPKTPFGEMRFERALEAYAQWRNAVAFFEREAKDLVTQKLGIPPEAKAFAVLPEALRNIAIKRPAELTRLMEASVRYHEVEEDIARNEEYLIQSAPFDRAKVESMVADAAARVEALSKTHAKILHERNVLREELDRGDRGFLGRIRDIFRRPESKILRDHSLPFEGPLTKEQAERAELLKKRFPKGFAACMAVVRGDEQQRTHEEAQEIIGKDEFSEKELTGALAESHKEYRALSKMLDEAMEEYAKVEREYQMVLKHRVKDRESALQTKDALTRQLEAMQLGVLQLGDASKVVSEEASNSARDVVRGILTDEQTPDAVVRADRFISAVRAAGARPEAGAAARDLLAALEIDIRSALEKRFAKTLSEYRPGSGKIREIARLFATYGDRGQEAAKRAMTSAIEQAQQSGDADRRLAYKALQVEYQTELLAAKEREKKAKEGSVKKIEDKKKKAA